MALEQPFTHWPFKTTENGGLRQQRSQKANFKRYDANESPFKDISPIPNSGRDFGTFPIREHQPRTLAREQLTQALNNRASRGFLPPDDIASENQFLPIPENREQQQPLDQVDEELDDEDIAHEQLREPRRGLTLMDRYGHSNRDVRPVRRTNSLLEFAEFVGRSSDRPSNLAEPTVAPQQQNHQRRRQQQQKQPFVPDQHSLQRRSTKQSHPRQPNGSPSQLNGYPSRQLNGDARQLNGGIRQSSGKQHPRAVPQQQTTISPIRPPVIEPTPVYYKDLYVERRMKRRRRRKGKHNLACGISLLALGFLVFAAFAAAFVVITVNGAWPTSGLLLIGVVFGLLMLIAGSIFICHRCLFNSSYDDDSRLIPIMDDTDIGGLHPVWQTSLQRSTLGRQEVAMTDFQDLPDGLQEPEPGIAEAEIETRIPNESGPIANGVPTPLAFAAPFKTTPNDYHLY